MSIENEPGPADGQRKREEQVHMDLDKAYAEQLKNDQDAIEARIRGETAVQFDNVRKLGFTTKQDIDESQKAYYGKYVEETKALRAEVTALREWVMRARQSGLNTGATDDKPAMDDPMKKWKPSW